MGVLDFLKGKQKEPELGGGLEVPAAPPSTEELPELPSPAEMKKAEQQRMTERPLTRRVESAERKAVREEHAELHERGSLELKKPIFMSLKLFKDIVEEVQMVSQILKENDDTLVRVSQFKEDEDTEFKKWENSLVDVQKKLIFADKTLFGTSE